jgi:o-succinylbenzoate synthase
MKQAPLTLFHYTIPFRKPFRSAAGEILEREGFLIGDGQGIWSEMAPLPGYSDETSGDVRAFLLDHGKDIHSAFRDRSLDQLLHNERFLSDLASLPSVRFGLSMLSEQQKATAGALPLYIYWKNQLFQKTPRNRGVTSEGYVRCNALAGLMEDDKRHQIIRYRNACGFRTIKLKVPADPDEAFEVIRNTSRTYHDLLFRFDMNKSFRLDQARELFGRMQTAWNEEALPQNIAYIEEPLSDPSPESLSELRAFGFPIAVDESVRTPEDVRSFESNASVTHLVIKPMLFGSFEELLTPLRSKLAVAISSTFETAIGRRLLAHIAAVSNVKRETDHGLDTGSLLLVDFAPRETGPHVHLGEMPGIGFMPNVRQEWLKHVKDF